MNEAVLERIHKIAEVYRSLAKHHPEAIREITFAELPEQVYNSNAIENSTLTLKDTEDILIRGQILRDAEIREVYEAKNLAHALELLYQNPHQHLTVELILALHKILLTGINDSYAGRFRSGHEWVRVGTHIGANPELTNKLMHELVKDYNKKDNREFIVKIACFHAEFECIHPFCDGNGRIGRVLINQQLMQLDLPPILIPAKNRHQDYYPALDAYDQKSDVSKLENYLALLLLESLHKYIAIINGAKLISVSDWAKAHNINPASALNKAKRQTIPAFRHRGQWHISADFTPEDD